MRAKVPAYGHHGWYRRGGVGLEDHEDEHGLWRKWGFYRLVKLDVLGRGEDFLC